MAGLEHVKNSRDENIVMMALHAEKAFDNVNLSWLFLVMDTMGFLGHFLSFLGDMYTLPTARVLMLGIL